MTPTISAIVIAKNEAEMIANCLDTLQWCDEVIVVDHHSVDTTAQLAERAKARVITANGSFADLRNEGLRVAKTDWVFYVDADERVTPKLADEVRQTIAETEHVAFAVGRNNILYGHYLEHGGWQSDFVVRLFNREKLTQWSGDVHEHAEIDGSTGRLTENLVHFTHRSIISGLLKTAEWTPIEATLLAQDERTPKVTAGLLLRKGVMEVFRRIVLKKGHRDGTAGWVEALVQGINRMLVYMQVWELQQKPSLAERYEQYERSVVKLWQQKK
jgi:glycosyltransferase involved in cell wall biosynthesis